jgi:hypothetical protein
MAVRQPSKLLIRVRFPSPAPAFSEPLGDRRRDAAAALGSVHGVTPTDGVLKRLDPAGAERALERLREPLAAHAGGDGISFDSGAWIVTARRR